MASVHVYVRLQMTGSDSQVQAVADAVEKVRHAVEVANGEWRGEAKVELDTGPSTTPESQPTRTGKK
jgi:hypothetical protein